MREMTDCEPEARRGDRTLHVLNAVLLAGLWVMTLYLYDLLPDRIPGHIGPSGVTRWTARESGMWFLMPILGTGQILLMYVLAYAATGSPDMINTPQKKRLLALPREGQLFAIRPLRTFMYAMAAWLLVLTAYVQLSLWRVAVAAQSGEPATGHLLVGILVLTALPLGMAYWLSQEIRRRIETWEQRADEGAGAV
jgi:uncharacterized membrane protein